MNRTRRLTLVAVAVVAFALVAPPAGAFHSGSTSCTFGDGVVRLRLAAEHVVRLMVVDRHIEYADLTDYSYRGRCGAARVGNTDRIVVRETEAGQSRLQFDQQLGGFGPGRVRESNGRSEIEVQLGTLTDIWIMGRPGADDVHVGERGVNLNGDRDADLMGERLREVFVFLLDGDDRLTGMGGRGAGDPFRSRLGGIAITGGSGNDVIEGSPRPDFLDGEFAGDVVIGRGGRDDLDGGPANDVVRGGRGDDSVEGGGGADRVKGGSHDDILLLNDYVADLGDGGTGSDRAFIDTNDTTNDVERTTYGDP